MELLQFIASSNFITLNKNIMKTFGLYEAIILGELASEYDYWMKRDELKDGYFFSTIENIEENTCLDAHKQRLIFKKLEKLGVLNIKLMGLPAKRYIKINEETLLKRLNLQLLKNLTTSSEKNEQLDVKNFNTNNNINNNNIINKNNNNNIYIDVIDFLNEKAKTNYRYNTSKTISLINARIKENYSLDDFKNVILNKCNEWLNTDMEKYLRPETLFGNKFESYLNQKEIKKNINNISFNEIRKANDEYNRIYGGNEKNVNDLF